VVFIFVSIQLLVVAYIDFKTRVISNTWFLINFLFFGLLSFIFPELYLWKVSTFIFPLAFVVVGFGLYILKIMGGGDSKYLSSLFLLVPHSFHENVFLYLLYTTVIVGSSLLLFNIIKNFDKIVLLLKLQDVNGIKKIFGKKFTYAPVIFISWMWFGWQNFSYLKF
jgi:prepilin peptidase CpaA